MKIAIAESSHHLQQQMKRIINQIAECHLIWQASDGMEVINQCLQHHPDLLLLDLQIEPIPCHTLIKRILAKHRKTTILLVTSCIDNNAAIIFQAMGAGAIDVVTIAKNAPNASSLKAKIVSISHLTKIRTSAPPKANNKTLIAMGASTGGPTALAHILKLIPAKINACITIIQHVDGEFSKGLADWLDNQCPLPVSLLQDKSSYHPGMIYIGSGKEHVILNKKLQFCYCTQKNDSFYKPSIDIFFNSLVAHWQGNVIAVLLTGIGKDGAAGLKNIYNHGWHTIAQDQQTSIVYGMPKEAYKLGAAEFILPIHRIADKIQKLIP